MNSVLLIGILAALLWIGVLLTGIVGALQGKASQPQAPVIVHQPNAVQIADQVRAVIQDRVTEQVKEQVRELKTKGRELLRERIAQREAQRH